MTGDSEERFRALVEHLSEGVIVIQDEHIVFANASASQIVRMSIEEMQRVGFLYRVHPDDRALVQDRQRRRLAGETVPDHYELRVVLEDGSVRWISIGAAVVPWGGAPAALVFFTDATERRATLEALRSSEERYRVVVDHAGEGIVVMVDEGFVFANSRACEILRMTREEILSTGMLHRLHPEDRALMMERRRERLAGGDPPSSYEVRLIDPDGGVRWMELGVVVVPWSDQLGTMTFFTDITGRKSMMAALHRSEERYRVVVEHVGEGMVVVRDGRFVFVNERATQITRLSREELMAHGYLRCIHPDDRAMVHERQTRRLAGLPVPDRYELRLLHDNGDVTWIDIGVTLVPWEGAQGTLTFFSDISERKVLEARLRRTLDEREAVLNSALVGMSFNMDRRFVWVNDKFAEMFGHPREAFPGQPTSMVYASEDQWMAHGAHTRHALETTGSYIHEREMMRADGRAIWVQLSGRCVVGRQPSQGVIWTVLDITERRLAEQEIREALMAQRELNDLRSRFVSMTSHEFRTPLAAILSSAELLRHYAGRMSDVDKDETLRSIEQNVQRMSSLLDRVLLIGRSDAQMLECRPRPIDLHALCRRMVIEAQALHPGSGVSVECSFEESTREGSFDESLLRHILGNLLSNAIKYSPRGGRVDFSIRAQDGRTRFTVTDQGIGIPAAEIAHLFASFHRASNVGDIPGTGLGLVIVKRALEAHGGQIQVNSEVGAGTCFDVLI